MTQVRGGTHQSAVEEDLSSFSDNEKWINFPNEINKNEAIKLCLFEIAILSLAASGDLSVCGEKLVGELYYHRPSWHANTFVTRKSKRGN